MSAKEDGEGQRVGGMRAEREKISAIHKRDRESGELPRMEF